MGRLRRIWWRIHGEMCGRYMSYKLGLAVFSVTFLIVLPLTCHDMKHSVYSLDWTRTLEDRQRVQTQANSQQLRRARQYLLLYNTTAGSSHKHALEQRLSRGELDVIITIVTMRRVVSEDRSAKTFGYLTQTLSKLHKLLHNSSRSDNLNVQVGLCNVDEDPTAHEEFHALAPLADVSFTRWSERYVLDTDIKQKELEDYTFCLNRSRHFGNPEYVIMLEDDAVPKTDFLLVLARILNKNPSSTQIKTRLEWTGGKTRIALIKLYRPERLIGYFSGLSECLELLLLSAVLASIFTGSQRICHRRPKGMNYTLTWTISFLYVAMVLWCVGRQNILELRRWNSPNFYQLALAPNCCSPAVLYPRWVIAELVSHLDSTICMGQYSKDNALDDFVLRRRGLGMYLLQPNLVTHIGYYSSVRKRFVDPIIV